MKTWIIEGNRQKLDGGSMFGNAPKALWSKWTEVDDQNRIPLATRTLLVQENSGRTVLFETGIGAFFEPKLKERYGIFENEHCLIENLKQQGFRPEDIDVIVLSHLHFDHAGGLLTAYGQEPQLAFPKAKFYVGKEHWVRAQNPHIREKVSFIPILHQLLKDSGRLQLFEGERHPDLDFVRFHYSNGHTIGLAVSEIHTDNNPIYFVSDLVPGVPWMHLPITMGYDRFPELLVDEKKQLFQNAVDSNGQFFFTHDPKVALATIAKDKDNRFITENANTV